MKIIHYTGSVTFSKDGYDGDIITSVVSNREHLRDLKILRRIYRDGRQVFKILIVLKNTNFR